MRRFCKHSFLLLLCFLPFIVFSQNKEELKNQKKNIEKEIKYTTELLNKTKLNKTNSLNYLKVLDIQIKKKETLLLTLDIEVGLINKQIQKIEHSIIEAQSSISKEEKLLKRLKDEYAKMIYNAYKQKSKKEDLVFVLSANNLNQAYKRMMYMRQYSSFRKQQVKKILSSRSMLEIKNKELQKEKEKLILESKNKNTLLETQKKELLSISVTKKEKKELLQNLLQSERIFIKKIKENQKKAKALDDKIRKIIEEEIAKSRKTKNNENYNLTPESLAISKGFINNKGKLPWPLEKGVIVGRYGKQKHSVFKTVETFNNGVDIATEKNIII